MATLRNLATALVLLIASHRAALACSLCFGVSTPGTLRAYYISTILLSAMPFVLIVCFVVFLRRHRLGGDTSASKAMRETDAI